ncbi:MAG: DUF4214 domain-containing protein, partial [Sulfitobacter sp.]|nr:DUF4214 domain-containing protein [Sulfitobacter sp.]
DDLANRLIGLDGDDTVFAEAGDDTIEGGSGNDEIAGGPGVDSLQLSGSDLEYHVAFYQDGTVKVEHKVTGGDGTDHLTGVEKIEFANGFWEMGVFDGIMSLSEGEIRSLVELYVAMFGRAPDATGLCFWGDVMANGMTLDEIAGHFFDQDEFRALYPDLSDSGALVDAIYQNVLNRAADTEGKVFWTRVIEEGALGPEKLVLAVLEGARAAAPDGTAPDFVAQKAADVAYLQGLVDLGVLFSAIKGLNDVDAAGTVMDTFDGGQPSLDAALDLIEAAYDAAIDPETGSFLVSLVGVIDDPFATGDIGMG